MFIKQLLWEQFGENDETIKHLTINPSWENIQEIFSHLDSQEYPSLFLVCGEQQSFPPTLTVFGGPDEYTISLERSPSSKRGAFERLQLINPSRFQNTDSHGWRGIGKGYHNYEVNTVYLTPDRNLILTVIQHFLNTGQWYPHAPFIVEAEDEEGEWRQYTV